MSNADILPAPEIDWPPVPTKFEQERWSFFKMLSQLLAEYEGQYVAIHEGRVVGHGDDQAEVALKAYDEFGYVPIYVGKVTSEPPAPVRIPTPRLINRNLSTDGPISVQHTG